MPESHMRSLADVVALAHATMPPSLALDVDWVFLYVRRLSTGEEWDTWREPYVKQAIAGALTDHDPALADVPF